MTDTEIIIECAKLDGWQQMGPGECHWTKYFGQPIEQRTVESELPAYLTSRDAIIPVIEKLWRSKLNGEEPTLESEDFLVTLGEICERLCHDEVEWSITPAYRLVLMKPRQLAIALLKATGKWRDG